jgi:uncharacterized membrane protein YhaH (DUF805 family)
MLFNREATPRPRFVLTVHRHLDQAREYVVHWYLQALRKYADFSGRAQRAEYWIPLLINVVLAFVVLLIDRAIGARNILYILFVLAWICPAAAMGVRRLHDTGRSGWWMLINLIPVGAIVLLVLLALEGEAGANQLGPIRGPSSSRDSCFASRSSDRAKEGGRAGTFATGSLQPRVGLILHIAATHSRASLCPRPSHPETVGRCMPWRRSVS